MSDLTDQQLMDIDAWNIPPRSGSSIWHLGDDVMALLLSAVDELRRRRAADDANRVNAAIADAAVALELERTALAIARDRYTRGTKPGSASNDGAWRSLKAHVARCGELRTSLQQATNVAVDFRRDPEHGKIVEAISKLDLP